MLKKIALIGGGNIGGVLAQELFQRKLARTVALVDVKGPDVAKGKCLDIAEGTPIIGSDVNYEAGKGYDVIKDADLVVNTAGVPRTVRPDGTFPSREELLATNLQITDAVAEAIKQYCPDAIVISIANPLDAIVFRLYQKLNPPKHKLMGMAGALDSSRYRYFVAQAAGVSVENVDAVVLGGHGDDMVPIRSCCRQVRRRQDARRDRGPDAQGRWRDRRPDRLLGVLVAGARRHRDGRGDRLRQAEDHPDVRPARRRVRREGALRGRAGRAREERHRADHRDRPE
jgi:hypothetical protein